MEIVNRASVRNLLIAVAESCTGGLISAAITSVPGSSQVFSYGFITYANEAKNKLVGVSESVLNQYGAVSEQVANSMASGALEVANADLAVAVTGIAGPAGGTLEKPIGLVYISIASSQKHCITRRFVFEGTRQEIRLQSVHQALTMLLEFIR